MNFVSKAFFFYLMGLSPLFADRCLQALLISDADKARMSLINYEPISSGGYRATHNLPILAFGDADVIVNGVTHHITPSAAAIPAIHFYFNALRKKIVTPDEVIQEYLRFHQMPPTRSIIFVNGDWVSHEELLKLEAEAAQNPKATPPWPIAERAKEKPSFTSLPSIFESFIRQGIDSQEYLIPKNLFTISSAQKFIVGKGVSRIELPWQSYKDYFDYQIPKNVLAFESGKASAEDAKQFPEMLRASSFAILKEATALHHPHELVVNYVHSPDEAHHRLYEIWGATKVQDSKTNNGHRLYAITLERMLELPRFDPTSFSERLSLVKTYSDRDLSVSQARMIMQTIRESMSIYLDADFAPLGDESSRIRVDDRSQLLDISTRSLLNAYGINSGADSFLNSLNKIKTLRFIDRVPKGYLPEEFEGELGGNLIVQELSHQCALKDPAYLAKALLAVSKWYRAKMQNLASQNMIYQNIMFSVITQSNAIKDQALSMGFQVRKLKHKPNVIANHQGSIESARTDLEFFEINVPLIYVDARFSQMNWSNSVQRGHWATAEEMQELGTD